MDTILSGLAFALLMASHPLAVIAWHVFQFDSERRERRAEADAAAPIALPPLATPQM
jgi:hypothetical protein